MRDFFLGVGFGLADCGVVGLEGSLSLPPPTNSGYTSVATDVSARGDAAWVATDAVPWGELAARPASADEVVCTHWVIGRAPLAVPWSGLVGLVGGGLWMTPTCSPAVWSLAMLGQ